MAPTIGAVGVAGCAVIAALVADTADVQPAAFVTVKLYGSVANPENVAVTPVPVMVVFPVVSVAVQVPAAGRPDKSTLPVATVQVGWVTAPTTGAVGVAGCAVIAALVADTADVQPAAFVTVK